MFLYGALACLLLCFSTTHAQRETLTNAKIVELVRLGFDEEIIIEKIRQSECRCDTSTEALAKLKVAKVSKAVILAMLNAEAGNKSVSENLSGKNQSPANPVNSVKPGGTDNPLLSQFTEPGIYLFEDGRATAIEPTVYSGTKSSFLGTALTYGIKKAKIRAVIRGKSANQQVKSARPEFYFVFSREYGNAGAVMSGFAGYAATSPAEFVLVTMKVKDNTREAVLGEVGAFSASTGAPDKFIREFSFEKIKPGVFKVVPKADLTAGEYCFYYAGAGGAASKVFDFSVQ
jgi:hypothetical protein